MTQAKRKQRAAPRKKAAARNASAAAPAPAPAARSRTEPAALRTVRDALGDAKAVDVREFDVRGLSDVTDFMVVASGTSDRHVKSIADRVVQGAKAAGVRPFGVEGQREGEWVLVDLPDVVVHVMLPRIRELYALEQLWAPPARAVAPAARATTAGPGGNGERRAPRRPVRKAARSGARPARP